MTNESNFPNHPELEARIVAWVLGEASPFEAAELERQIAVDPALAAFKRRIEAVHGLVAQAAGVASGPPLRLPDEKRAKLLATIGAGATARPESEPVLPLPSVHSQKPWWQVPLWVSSVAACLMVGVVVVTVVLRYGDEWSGPTDATPASVAPGAGPHFLLKNSDAERPSLWQRIVGESGTRQAAAAAAKKREAVALAVAEAKQREAERLLPEQAEMERRTGDLAAERRKPRRPDPDVTSANAGTVVLPSSAATRAQLTVNGTLFTPAVNGTTWGASTGAAPAVAAPPLGAFVMGGNVDGTTVQTFRSTNSHPYVVVSAGAAASQKGSGVVAGRLGSASDGGSIAAAKQEEAADSVVSTDALKLEAFTVPAQRDRDAASPAAKPAAGLRSLDAPLAITTFGGAETPSSSGVRGLADAKRSTGTLEDAPIVHPKPAVDEALGRELPTAQQPISTFSLHVSDVSFRLALAALARGERPDPSTIRPEEFYNAFDYGDPAPVAGEPVGCRIEQAAHPFLPQRNLVRIALKVPATGRGAGQPLRLTVLLDTSGSMEREDRVATVRRAFEVLAGLLGPADRVTLIGFARQPRLLAENVAGNDARQLVDIVAKTPAEGGTNLEEALKLAGDKARALYAPGAQNRIIVLSDGAANLGNDNPEHLAAQVTALRQQGFAFDACGVGADGLDDSVLEALTRKGDGRYALINSPEEADANFARKLAGALRPAAENVKVQVRFNPERVASYRLIGFEQHRLRAEDFRNDRVTAAEMAADEAGVALYQIELRPNGDGELGDVFVRFRNAATGAMVERSWTLPFLAQPPTFDHASASLQLCGTAAFVAEKLRGGPLASQIPLADFAPIITRLRGEYAHDRRVQDFVTLFNQSRRLLGE